MSACKIIIGFGDTAAAIVSRAENAITRAGGTFSGNETDGSFAISTPVGSIKGSYTITGQEITLNITDKPFFLGCGKIESELRRYLGVGEV